MREGEREREREREILRGYSGFLFERMLKMNISNYSDLHSLRFFNCFGHQRSIVEVNNISN